MQIEQDTGKTLSAPPFSLVDLNRVGVPLVEIITDPFALKSADVAAKVVAKLQGLLRAVDACVVGMEWGGLRADVNISVAKEGQELGQRCEIKNLSSFKAIEDAVSAEAKRQIALLEEGGEVQGETRGWDQETLTTHRLRGKEGEVDYRFMPEPDLPAVVVSREVVEMVRGVMPPLPEVLVKELVGVYGLSAKDARTLLALDDGRTACPGGVVTYLREATQELVTREINTCDLAFKNRLDKIDKPRIVNRILRPRNLLRRKMTPELMQHPISHHLPNVLQVLPRPPRDQLLRGLSQVGHDAPRARRPAIVQRQQRPRILRRCRRCW